MRKSGPVADDRLALAECVAALPRGAAVGIGTVHASDDHIGPVETFDVHGEDRFRRLFARFMRLRQPNVKTLFLEEAREIDVEPLLGERKQRTG